MSVKRSRRLLRRRDGVRKAIGPVAPAGSSTAWAMRSPTGGRRRRGSNRRSLTRAGDRMRSTVASATASTSACSGTRPTATCPSPSPTARPARGSICRCVTATARSTCSNIPSPRRPCAASVLGESRACLIPRSTVGGRAASASRIGGSVFRRAAGRRSGTVASVRPRGCALGGRGRWRGRRRRPGSPSARCLRRRSRI